MWNFISSSANYPVSVWWILWKWRQLLTNCMCFGHALQWLLHLHGNSITDRIHSIIDYKYVVVFPGGDASIFPQMLQYSCEALTERELCADSCEPPPAKKPRLDAAQDKNLKETRHNES